MPALRPSAQRLGLPLAVWSGSPTDATQTATGNALYCSATCSPALPSSWGVPPPGPGARTSPARGGGPLAQPESNLRKGGARSLAWERGANEGSHCWGGGWVPFAALPETAGLGRCTRGVPEHTEWCSWLAHGGPGHSLQTVRRWSLKRAGAPAGPEERVSSASARPGAAQGGHRSQSKSAKATEGSRAACSACRAARTTSTGCFCRSSASQVAPRKKRWLLKWWR